MIRQPYVKQFKDGVILNPITKDRPYLHIPKVPKIRQASNNSGGHKVVVVNIGKGKFMKYHVKKQLIPCVIPREGMKPKKFKVITHYIDTKQNRAV